MGPAIRGRVDLQFQNPSSPPLLREVIMCSHKSLIFASTCRRFFSNPAMSSSVGSSSATSSCSFFELLAAERGGRDA